MRTWLYIDGYNFYYGIRKGPSHLPVGLGWCNFRVLCERFMLRQGDRLERIRYFTAPVSKAHDPYKEADRQQTWLRAVKTVAGLDVTEGIHFHPEGKRTEKMTDVNIAVELLLNGSDEQGYEKAIILSGDLDLFPAALAVTTRLRRPKSVEFWISPDTQAHVLQEYCKWHGMPCFPVKPDMLFHSRFPDEFEHGGEKIVCEPRWRLPASAAKTYA